MLELRKAQTMETNPTKMQVFLRKKIFWKSFYHTGYIHSFSLAEGFGGIDLQKPNVQNGGDHVD